MLQVYETEQERREAFAKLRDIPGYNSSPSGLTPPTKNIILRRFLKSRQYEPSEVLIISVIRFIDTHQFYQLLFNIIYICD